MDAQQYLFYGFGKVAYAAAMADGEVQTEEEKKLHDIMKKAMEEYSIDFDYADIIFQVSDTDESDATTAYKQGIESMKLGSHYLTDELSSMFKSTMLAITRSFEGVSIEEQLIMDRFAKDLKEMKKTNPIS